MRKIDSSRHAARILPSERRISVVHQQPQRKRIRLACDGCGLDVALAVTGVRLGESTVAVMREQLLATARALGWFAGRTEGPHYCPSCASATP